VCAASPTCAWHCCCCCYCYIIVCICAGCCSGCRSQEGVTRNGPACCEFCSRRTFKQAAAAAAMAAGNGLCLLQGLRLSALCTASTALAGVMYGTASSDYGVLAEMRTRQHHANWLCGVVKAGVATVVGWRSCAGYSGATAAEQRRQRSHCQSLPRWYCADACLRSLHVQFLRALSPVVVHCMYMNTCTCCNGGICPCLRAALPPKRLGQDCMWICFPSAEQHLNCCALAPGSGHADLVVSKCQSLQCYRLNSQVLPLAYAACRCATASCH
jgi:hypothetical protein